MLLKKERRVILKKIVVAIDSFKGSLSTFEAGKAIEEAAKEMYENAEVTISPIADGGEGTVEAIISATNGNLVRTVVCNPLGEKIEAIYGFIPHTKTAIIEMSAAAGITLVNESERNPMNTTTFGVGEMILDAISKGCRKFVIGIGGSATNDGGVGMLQALGFEFLDKDGKQVLLGAKGLKDIAVIKTENAVKELKECSFCVACDVKNILCGENGCSAVYGPQKGATPEMIENMDLWLKKYAQLTKDIIQTSDANIPGTGAAGTARGIRAAGRPVPGSYRALSGRHGERLSGAGEPAAGAAPLSEKRLPLVAHHGGAGLRRHSGRRYGPWQNGADYRPAIGCQGGR